MSLAETRTKKLQCPSCGGWFRIESRPGRPLPAEVPCPSCGAEIPVREESNEPFLVSKSRAEIFERGRSGARAAGEENREESTAPAGHRVDRSFRDVSEFRDETRGEPTDQSGSERAEQPSVQSPPGRTDAAERSEAADAEAGDVGSESPGPPFEQLEREPPDADLDAGDRQLKFTAARRAENVTGTPLPLPVETEETQGESETSARQESAPESGEVEQSELSAGVESQQTEPEANSAESSSEDPPPAAELATIPFADWEEEPTDGLENRRFDLRVHDTVREDVDFDGLTALFREGIWSGAVDIRVDGSWVPLDEHPVFERIRDELVGQSRQILLERPGEEEVADEKEEGRPPEEGSADALNSELDAGGEREVAELPELPPSPPSTGESSGADELPGDSSETEGEPEGGGEKGNRKQRLAVVTAGLWIAGTIVATVALLNWGEKTTPPEGDRPRAGASTPDEGDDAEASETIEPPRRDGSAVAAARSTVERALTSRVRAEGYLEGGALKPARRMAVRAMAKNGVRGELQEIFAESIRRDKSLVPTPVTVGRDVEVDAIHALGGGWSLSFRMTEGGEDAFAFKPAQEDWERGWRSEIAAYHLCEVVTCHFEVPRNRPARIRKSRFLRLYGRVGGESQQKYRRRFDELVWRREEGPDGEMHQYLYGTLKDWVPEFVKWPIEYEMVWRPLLGRETSPEILDQPFEKSLAPLKKKGKEDFYESILEEKGEATTRSMARQLSSILVFDYLTTNWDRFSTAEKFYGVNNQFADGTFISIDNGAAFSPHHFGVVTRRLAPVTRYSANTIASIRALQPSVTNPILFPNPTTLERRRLAVFWEQRNKLVDRVHGLVAEHGRESIYAFD